MHFVGCSKGIYVKSKGVPAQAVTVCGGDRYIAPLILNLCTRQRTMVSFTAPSLYLRWQKTPSRPGWEKSISAGNQTPDYLIYRPVTMMLAANYSTVGTLLIQEESSKTVHPPFQSPNFVLLNSDRNLGICCKYVM